MSEKNKFHLRVLLIPLKISNGTNKERLNSLVLLFKSGLQVFVQWCKKHHLILNIKDTVFDLKSLCDHSQSPCHSTGGRQVPGHPHWLQTTVAGSCGLRLAAAEAAVPQKTQDIWCKPGRAACVFHVVVEVFLSDTVVSRMLMKVPSQPRHGNSEGLIVVNWTCFCFLKTFHFSFSGLFSSV